VSSRTFGVFTPVGHLFFWAGRLLVGESELGWRAIHIALVVLASCCITAASRTLAVPRRGAWLLSLGVLVASGVPSPAVWLSTAPYWLSLLGLAWTLVSVARQGHTAPFAALVATLSRELGLVLAPLL